MSVVPQKTSRRDLRWIVLIVTLNVAIIGVIGFALATWFFAEEWTYYTVGDYDLDQGRFIKIVGEKSNLSHAVNLRYEVLINGKVIVPRDADGAQFFMSTPTQEPKDPREFSIVPVRQGDLVAITDRTRHDDIVILHDFITNQSWPAHGKGEAEGLAVGREMLLRLQRVYPFFSCSALSEYRPRWVWSPKLTRWLVTYPDVPKKSAGDETSRLAIRVFDTRNRLSCFLKTNFASEEFHETTGLGWMGNDVVVVGLDPEHIRAWKLNEEEGLTATELPLNDAIRARAAELLASPQREEQFVIPSPLLLFPEEDAPVTDETSK